MALAHNRVGKEPRVPGAQMTLGVSDKVGRVFQGLLLFFVLGCDTLINYKVRLVLNKTVSAARGQS